MSLFLERAKIEDAIRHKWLIIIKELEMMNNDDKFVVIDNVLLILFGNKFFFSAKHLILIKIMIFKETSTNHLCCEI